MLSATDVLAPEKKDPQVEEQPANYDSKFTAEQYIQHNISMEQISLRASEPIRRMWDRAWGLYNNAYDFSLKAQWQSKNSIPRINMTVRAATFMIKRGLLGPNKAFTVEGVGDFGKLVAYYMDKLVQNALEDANYVTRITDSLHAGMLSSLMCLKVYPVYTDCDSPYWSDPMPKPMSDVDGPVNIRKYKQLKIRIDAVDPYHLYLDPTGQNKFYTHNITMDLYDLVTLADDESNGFDKDEVAKIHEDFARTSTENPNAQPEFRSGQAPETSERRRARTVLLQEYWGDVWTPSGKLIARNVTYTVANRKYLVKKPKYNRLPDGLSPFIVAPVIRKPFSVWHQGFVDVVAGLQVMMTELMNLIIDANMFASVKAFEVDIDQVYDPLEFIQGVAPGKTYKKRGGGFNTAPMIKDISMGNLNAQSLTIFQQLDREFQNGVGLNEFSMPTNRSSGSRTTATEVMQKSESASTFMEEVARSIEESVIEPMTTKIAHYIIEYMLDFRNPEVMELFGQEDASKLEVLMLNPVFRKAMHTAPFKFKSRGLSASMAKLRDLDKLGQVAKIIQMFPSLGAKLDPDKVLKRIIEGLGWYPQDLLAEMGNPTPAPSPLMGGAPMPQTPISGMGNLSGYLGNANSGMQQVPNVMGG